MFCWQCEGRFNAMGSFKLSVWGETPNTTNLAALLLCNFWLSAS
jgi:hypothetical protein